MKKDERILNSSKFQIDRDRLAPAGIEGYLVLLDKSNGDKRTDEERMRDQSAREFEVKCALRKSFTFPEEIQCSIPEGYGDSYLLMPQEEDEAHVKTPYGEYNFSKNEKNEISMISLICPACSWQESLDKFFSGITPILDLLSYSANTPVIIEKVYCRDNKNDLSVVNYRTPYSGALVNAHAGKINVNMLPLYSLYREAKNSFSNYYKFLCYYKIIEGVFHKLRPLLMIEARKQNIKIVPRKELVPSHPELNYFQRSYVGMPIKVLFDKEFTPEYRNAVAHFYLDNGTLLNPSDYYSTVKFKDIILLSELCAREVINIQSDYYVQFSQHRSDN